MLQRCDPADDVRPKSSNQEASRLPAVETECKGIKKIKGDSQLE